MNRSSSRLENTFALQCLKPVESMILLAHLPAVVEMNFSTNSLLKNFWKDVPVALFIYVGSDQLPPSKRAILYFTFELPELVLTQSEINISVSSCTWRQHPQI